MSHKTSNFGCSKNQNNFLPTMKFFPRTNTPQCGEVRETLYSNSRNYLESYITIMFLDSENIIHSINLWQTRVGGPRRTNVKTKWQKLVLINLIIFGLDQLLMNKLTLQQLNNLKIALILQMSYYYMVLP